MKSYIEPKESRLDIAKHWTIRFVAGVAFILIGRTNFGDHSGWIQIFAQIGLGQWFRYFTGIFQVLGGVLVLIPRTFGIGLMMIASTMLGAVMFWIFIG